MKKINTLIGLILLSLGIHAHADNCPLTGGTVRCVEAKVANGPVIWFYVIKQTKSHRLGSDVQYNNGTTTAFISSFQVAQYDADDDSLFMLVDDHNEDPTMQFIAESGKCGTYNGTLQTLNPTTGNATSTKKVECSVTP